MRVVLGTCVVLAVAIPLSVAPIVRSVAARKAAERGLLLDVDDVSLGFGRVTLRDARARLKTGEALDVVFDAVDIVPTWTLGVKRVMARGGRVTLRGSVTELRQALESLHGPGHSRGQASAEVPSERNLSVQGVGVTWYPGREHHAQHLWGLSASLVGGTVSVRFDLARLEVSGFGVDVVGGHAQLAAQGRLYPVQRIGARSVSAWADLGASHPNGWFGELRGDPAAPHPPAAVASSVPTGTPPPAAGSPGASFAPHRGRQLRDLATTAAQSLDRVVPKAGALELAGLVLEVRSDKQSLKLGPASLLISRAGESIQVALRPAPSAATGLDVALKLPLREGPVDFTVAGGPISLAALGVREGDFGLQAVQGARLEARAKVRLLSDGAALEFDGVGSARDLTLHQPRISATTLRHINLGWSGRGTLRFDTPRVEIETAQVELGAVRLEVSGSAERTEAYFAVDARARVPLASCQTMMQSAPAGLFPALEGLRMSGAFSMDAKVAFDSRRPSDILVGFGLDNRCVVTQAPQAVDPRRYHGPFTYQVQTEDGVWLDRQSGPGTSGWVELGNISKYMEAAVLVCEDGRFFHHEGFDRFAIQSAIRQNLEAGKFLRGASTISMQLAKNLYLGREKTMARKLQEAVFTMMLEQALSKEQILELYFNVIEYGPGLYGIGPATRFYFDKEPAELTMTQSFYLASLLPNPRHDHFDKNGVLSSGWQTYLKRLMSIAEQRRLVTPEELESAVRERLVFGRSEPLSDDSLAIGEPLADPYERGASKTEGEGRGVRLSAPEDSAGTMVKPRRSSSLRTGKPAQN